MKKHKSPIGKSNPLAWLCVFSTGIGGVGCSTPHQDAHSSSTTVQAHDLAQMNQNICINNLRHIDAAKQQWAIENKKTGSALPADAELFGADAHIPEKPKCPSGGTYTIEAIDEPPVCSIADHILP